MKKIENFFINIQPYSNSLTGLAVVYNFPSIFGPIFYGVYLCLFVLTTWKRRKGNTLALSIAFIVYFFILFLTRRTGLENISSILKFILPIYVFFYFKNLTITRKRLEKIDKLILQSFFVYCIMTIFSFIIGYKIQPRVEGYFGTIYAGNDLIVLYILMLFYFQIRLIENIKYKFLVISAYFLSYSKSFFLLLPIVFFEIIKKIKFRYIILISFTGVSVFIYYIKNFWGALFDTFFPKSDSFINIFFDYDIEYILNFFTFGRYNFVSNIFKKAKPNIVDNLIGMKHSDIVKMLNGRVGTEMDIIDAMIFYGIFGVLILIFFYYIPIFKKIKDKQAKVIFGTVVTYSLLGGHYYNNPLVGSYYGLILGLIYNKNQSVVSEFFKVKKSKGVKKIENSNGNEYSSTL